MSAACSEPRFFADAARLGALATRCLDLELDTFPKPGLVSPVDCGSHPDMDADLFRRSAAALTPFFAMLAQAGAAQAGMGELRRIGRLAEVAMLDATEGINTHRGAIFGLGLLCAAAARAGAGMTLGAVVRDCWGSAILAGPSPRWTHGAAVARRYGAGGAREEAALGFPSLYRVAVPALRTARALAPGDEEAARVQACFALIAAVADTNLLHRGGPEGLAFAQASARAFLAKGGVAAPDWCRRAASVHRRFVARRLSPGGCADLLAMALFVEQVAAGETHR
jgi:triphosphoribosyl-dephospho-CoA synthase